MTDRAERQEKHPKGKGCWYEVDCYACVICGREEILRERKWTPKPAAPTERFHYIETACGGHFL